MINYLLVTLILIKLINETFVEIGVPDVIIKHPSLVEIRKRSDS